MRKLNEQWIETLWDYKRHMLKKILRDRKCARCVWLDDCTKYQREHLCACELDKSVIIDLGIVNEKGFLPCWWNDSLYPEIEEWMGDDEVEQSKMFVASCEDENHKQEATGRTMLELMDNWNGRVTKEVPDAK